MLTKIHYQILLSEDVKNQNAVVFCPKRQEFYPIHDVTVSEITKRGENFSQIIYIHNNPEGSSKPITYEKIGSLALKLYSWDIAHLDMQFKLGDEEPLPLPECGTTTENDVLDAGHFYIVAQKGKEVCQPKLAL